MNVQTIIAVLALLVSFLASTIAILQTRRIGQLSRMPILVIIYDGRVQRWVARNVGNGPALNIIVAQRAEDDTAEWYNAVSIPAIGAGDAFTLEWLGDTGEYSLGARYSDFLDSRQESTYFTYTRDDRCSVHLPRRHPKWIMPPYEVFQVQRYWWDGLTWERSRGTGVDPAPAEKREAGSQPEH